MTNNELYLAISVMSIANILTRVFPFLFFTKNNAPSYIEFIAKNFPPMIMIILIFYTLSKIDFSLAPYGLKEIISILFTAVLHIRFSNYLVSIFLGTIFYMTLVQFIN